MKKRILIAVTLLLFSLASCASKKESVPTETTANTKNISDTENKDKDDKNGTSDTITIIETETTPSIQESGNEYTAMLYVDDIMNYEITLRKGRMISILSKDGYQFEGYYTAWDENYVTKDGIVIREYNGADMLRLYPKFSPLEYEIKFYHNGKETNILKRYCSYEMNIMDLLPMGEVLGEECIVGFQDDNKRLIIGRGMEELYLKDLQNVLDNESRELKLNLITTAVYYEYERLDRYEINDNGFFEQELDEKGLTYELCSLERIIDIPALESFGYQNVEIEVTCLIREENSGNQHIRLYATEVKDKKEEYLMDSGKIEDIEKGEEKEYTMKAVVPIEKLESQKVYVYYNASGIGKDNWVSPKMRMTFTFLDE